MADRASVDPIATSEDECLAWFPRTISRRQALGFWADWCYMPRRQLKARKRHLRPASESEDCPAWPHGVDGDGERPEDCLCGQIEDGWFFQCSPEHPDAVAVWRVEDRPRRLRRKLCRLSRATLYRRRQVGRHKPVLWGGLVERKATRLDGWLGCGAINLLGDSWLRPEPVEWIYCDVCGCKTPRYVDTARVGGSKRCLASSHFGRQFGRTSST